MPSRPTSTNSRVGAEAAELQLIEPQWDEVTMFTPSKKRKTSVASRFQVPWALGGPKTDMFEAKAWAVWFRCADF
ncbi:unnamed protein product [Durusdinium trenchii]|uniref:Uncharacterized protein n=1 Tax=Durusdinium trenchii TaxID=1381693 RepID=A0ABP0NVN9_9DINO